MPEVIMVTGTGTGVGKTWVTVRLIEALRERGLRVAARKPAESFAPEDAETDSSLLARASGEDRDRVCPPHRRYPAAMAPVMAADALGADPFSISDLVDEIDIGEADLVLVEGAGGPRSPLAADGDTLALGDALGAGICVLVADAGLGTINAVLTCQAALDRRPFVTFLNRFAASDDLHRRNLSWLAERESLEVFVEVDDLATRLGGTRADTLRSPERTMEAR